MKARERQSGSFGGFVWGDPSSLPLVEFSRMAQAPTPRHDDQPSQLLQTILDYPR